MKLLGHAWVAVNVVPRGNNKLLILGSVIPEIMFYTRKQPFSFEEIHEGGKNIFQYLIEQKPEWRDLGLGMITHSAEKGADKFNSDKDLVLLGYSEKTIEKLRRKLSLVLRIPYKKAKDRVHNIIELAIDLGIIKTNPKFINEFLDAIEDKQSLEEVKSILSECFRKPRPQVNNAVNELFEKIRPGYFRNARGLSLLWAEFASALPDPEPNIRQLTELLEELSIGFNGRDKKFLDRAIGWTKINLETF